MRCTPVQSAAFLFDSLPDCKPFKRPRADKISRPFTIAMAATSTESPVGPNGWLRISMAVARSRRTCSLARPAVLTVLRAWHMAGTTIGVTPMGSFEEWSYRVRQPVLWLERDDPCDSIATVRENDPSRDALLAVLLEWKRALGIRNSHTVQQIIARALTNMDFFSALMGSLQTPPAIYRQHTLGLLAASGRGQD